MKLKRIINLKKKINKNNDIQAINKNSKNNKDEKFITLKKAIKYLYIKKSEKRFRFSLSKYIENTNTGYYKCNDSQSAARGKIQYNFENINELDLNDKKFEDSENIILTKNNISLITSIAIKELNLF